MKSSQINRPLIENTARELQLEVWKYRKELWPNKDLSPIEMLEPEIAAHVLGIKFEYEDHIRNPGFGGEKGEIAGLIDRQAGKISISKTFYLDTIRFTGAHELGHWQLHPDHKMFRDRPIQNLAKRNVREPKEIEADYFASCFLMPGKQVVKFVEIFFQTRIPFVIDENASFWLNPDNPTSLLRPEKNSLDRLLAVASNRFYAGKHHYSLAEIFKVSVTAMAIRLNELNVIKND